jgi:hypothetical protein
MLVTTHCGLYFDESAIAHAHSMATTEPYASAFAFLNQPYTSVDMLSLAMFRAFRWRILADDAAGQAVCLSLQSGHLFPPVKADALFHHHARTALACAQLLEMARNHPHFSYDVLTAWQAQIEPLLNAPTVGLVDQAWQIVLSLACGVVLEDDQRYQAALHQLKQVIETELHPEGFIPNLVQNSKGGALIRQGLVAQALVLGAQLATVVGDEVWQYEVRGVSVKTPAIYAVAYYEYPASWKWDTPPTTEEVEAFFAERFGFFEMLNRNMRQSVMLPTLKKIRPIFDPYGGGLTTLTHATAHVARQGWFRR